MRGCKRRRAVAISVALVAALLAASEAWADQHIWTGGGDGVSWGDGANWNVAAVPVSGDTVLINPGADLAITLTGPQACGTVTLSTASNVTISGTGTLTMDDASEIIRDAACTGATGYTISCNVTFGTNGTIRSNAATSPFTFSGIIAGASDTLAIYGGPDLTGGQVVFSGPDDNTMSADVVLYRGRLILNKTAGVDAVGAGGVLTAGDFIVNGGVPTIVRLDAANQIPDNTDVYALNGSTVDFNNNSDTVQVIGLIEGATVQTGTGTLTISAAGSISLYDITAGTYTSTISGNLNLGGTTREFYIKSGHTLDLTANVSSSGAFGISLEAFANTSAGTLVLSGNNTYTGVTTVSAGTLIVESATALGNASSAVLVGDTAGTFSASLLTGAAVTIDRDITVQTGNSGVMTIGGNTAEASGFSGDITLDKDATFTAANGGTVDFSGAVSGAGGVTKSGAGTAVYSGAAANTYTGATTVSEGTLELDKTGVNAIAGAITVGNGAGTDTLSWTSSDQIADAADLTLAGGGVLDFNGNTDAIDDMTISGGSTASDATGRIIVEGDLTHGSGTFTNNATVEVQGAFNASGGTLAGGGTVILSATANQTFTPPTTGGIDTLYVNDGLVGYWKFDETAGVTADDSSGYTSDGAHTNSPTISSNVPTTEFNNPRSLGFNGTDEYVLAPADPALNRVETAVTVSAWVYKTAADFGSWGVISQRRRGAGNLDLWTLTINNSADDEYMFYPGTADVQYLVGPSSTADVNTWVHIAGVYNGTTTKIYRNGVEVATSNANSGAIPAETSPVIIGAADNGTDGYQEFFQGNIDDVRVYNVALTAPQIAELAAGRQPGIAAPTITLGGPLDVDDDLIINGGTLDVSAANSYPVTVGDDWINNGGDFNARAGNVTLNGAADQTLQPGGENFYNLTINNTGADGDDDVTLGGNLTVDNTLTITNGTLVQGPYDITAGGITVGAGGAWENQSTGDVALGAGGVNNSGTILLDGGGGGWGGADSIDITSTSAGAQRPWVGSGDFFLYDTNVTDQGGTAPVSVSSGTNVGGNGANFYFADSPVVGITVTPTSGLETTEAGGDDTFTVVLTSQPTAGVTIGITSSDLGEGTVAPASVTFTTGNWFTAQTVTVTGVDDGLTDGNILYTITTAAAVSADGSYSGLNADDVTVTNLDDEAGITVSAISGATTEAGGTATFTIVLDSAPSNDVTIGLSSSDTTEGTVDPASVTFTTANWDTPQTVTVTGVDDDVDDGNIAYNIVTAAATSVDAAYNGMNAANVAVTNTDNDAAGITVTPTSGLTTTEAAGTATFTVVLVTEPTADVTIGISSSDTTEGTVDPATLTFTAANWDTPQTVTVTGANDDVDDGDIAYNIVTAAATSADGNYDGVNASDVSATNTDNDTAGITVAPTSDLLTTEGGGTDTFTVVLNTEPTADVTIGVTSSNTAEGTVAPATLTFTAANWDTPQTVTVTGANDGVVDGHRWYGVILAAAASADGNYNGMNAADLQAINLDDDASGIVVLETSNPYTTESGGTATFVVVLAKLPTGDVTVGVASSDITEGTVPAASLTFTTGNWSTPQTVTVTGVDDGAVDGHIDYSIVTAAAVSADASYSGLNPQDVALINLDNDAAGVAIIPTSGLITTEGGGADTFIAVLARDPSANVTIGIASSDTAEGTVAPASLTFTASNWATPQTVTVTGVDEAVTDGNRTYRVVTAAAASADPAYSGLNPADVSVMNIDDDAAGVTIIPTADLVTTEGGGTDSFIVILNRVPTGDVTIALTSSDITEGTVSPASLTFTTANWGVPRTVTLTGVNDADVDGRMRYAVITGVAASTDVAYDGLNPFDVSAVNLDDDASDIAVIPTSGLVTDESGASDTFRVVLARAPTGSVALAVTSSDTSEGTASPVTLIFTTSNWSVPQTVTLTGADDAIVDGNRAYAAILGPSVSTDASYNATIPDAVLALNLDNDAAGVTVTPRSGLITTEGGGAAEFTVTLNKLPTANVTISLSSSNTDEGTVSPTVLIFTEFNWSIPRTVTVTGVDDSSADGNREYSVVTGTASSVDGAYDGLNPADVEILNLDDDAAGIAVVPTSNLLTAEWGRADAFRVVLSRAPGASVTVALSTSDATEGAVSPATLAFTTTNWSVPQWVTVTGVDDAAVDGNIAYTVVTGTLVSSDGDYHGLDPDDISATNLDDDAAGVTALPVSGLTTAENGGSDTFILVLNRLPSADVTVGLSCSDATEGAVSPSSLVFGSTSWFVPQTVEVTGVDDDEPDGDVAYTIVTAAAVSADGSYSGVDASDVSVTNEDDDVLNAIVTPVTGLITTEGGRTDTFTIVLSSRPTANVTIPLTSNHTGEGTVAPASVTFTTANWDTPQTVTVTGVDDAVADGNVVYTILTGAAVSPDSRYNGLNLPDVTVTNLDDESPAISVVPTSGLVTTESGGTATFRVVLNTLPSADVTMGLTSSDTAEGTVSPASLTFTAANWDTPQTVTATGVEDAEIDGARLYTMVTAAAVSVDGAYNGLNPADVSLTNLDNDEPLVAVYPASGLITTESGGTDVFQVVLTSAPTADVTVALSSSDATEGTVVPSSLLFTTSDWSTPRTVAVSGVDDAVLDGNVSYTAVTGIVSSDDLDYHRLNPPDVSVVNIDNDASGITVAPTSGLVTSETGGTATFRVVLNRVPAEDVTVGISSSDATEGTAAPASLTFTSTNWSAAQTVTVTGQSDGDEINVAYTILTAASASADPDYDGVDPDDVSVLNLDNNVKAVTVIPTSGLVTSERGETATFTIVLNRAPTANVAIALSSSDATEGSVSPASVTFTTSNWSVPRTVTLTGVDDDAIDGDIAYAAVTGFAVSGDAGYNNMNPDNVAAVNLDNDGTAGGVTVTPTGGLTTSESGETDLFTVVLTRAPTANVQVSFTSSDTTEGTVSPASVTFTTANWATAQTVTVTGVSDSVDDGDVAYTILTARAQSADDTFDNVNPSDVSVTNEDDDVAGTVVTPTRDLLTTEGGGVDAFTVVLTSQPTADVTIGIASSDTSEATVAPASLTFTSANWNSPQVATVTGVDDADLDGNVAYAIVTAPAVSVDGAYNGFNPSNVRGINVDDDQPGITVVPTSRLLTSEAGMTDEIRVVLNRLPTGDVTIPLGVSDSAEASIAPAALTFTPANWDIPQAATITGVDDLLADGHVEYAVLTGPAVSDDPDYDGLNPVDARATNLDDETPAIMVLPTSGLVTAENGGSDTFVIVLATLPTSSVTIPLSSSDVTAGTVSVASVTFTPADWNVPQTVVVTGVNNGASGNISYTIITGAAASADAGYTLINPSDVSVTAVDDDAAGITVLGPVTLTTDEAGRSDTFEIVLNTEPTATVTIPLTTSDAAEGSISPASLVFTASSWSSPQTVVVTGVDDASDDGDVAYSAVTGAAVSGDAGYNAMNAADANAVNLDNDLPSAASSSWSDSHDDAGFGSCFGSTGGVSAGRAVLSLGLALLLSVLVFRRKGGCLWAAIFLLAATPAFAAPVQDDDELPLLDFERLEVQPVVGVALFSDDFDADPEQVGGLLARIPLPRVAVDGIWAFGEVLLTRIDRDFTPEPPTPKDEVLFFAGGMDWEFILTDEGFVTAQLGLIYSTFGDISGLDGGFAPLAGFLAGVRVGEGVWVNLDAQVAYSSDTNDSVVFLLAGVQIEY